MKIFDAHNWLKINDFHAFMGKETHQRGVFDYSDRLLGDIASCGSYGIVTSKGISGRLSRVTIHHGAGRARGGCRVSHMRDKENRRRTYVLSTLQGTARP